MLWPTHINLIIILIHQTKNVYHYRKVCKVFLSPSVQNKRDKIHIENARINKSFLQIMTAQYNAMEATVAADAQQGFNMY